MTKVTAGLTLLAAAFALSLGPAMAFESAFTNVAKTVEGTPEQLSRIRTEILGMADEMPIAATEIAQVAATAGQLGIATEDVIEFTRVMVMLGTATNLTADQAATSMARFTNIMQIPVSQLPLLSAALVHLGNNSAATESEILTLGLRLAAAGSQLGLSGQQVLALSAAMKSLGITAEVGGSAMSRVLIDMVTASGPKLDTFAKLVGVTRQEFETLVKSRSPEAAGKLVLGFVEGLQKVDERGGSVRKVLQDLGLDSIRLRDTLFRLVGGGDQLARSFALVSDASVYGGALLNEYGRFAETTANRLQILKNRLTGIAIDLGTPTLGAVATIFDGIGDAALRLQSTLAPIAGEIRGLFSNLGEGLGDFYRELASPALTAGVAGLGGLAQVIGALAGAFNSLGPAGLILAALLADLYLVGPVSIALQTFRVAVAQVGVASAASAAGVGLLKTALQFGPLALATAGIILIGKAMQDASSDAREMARALSLDLAQSLEDGDWDGFSLKIQNIQRDVAALDASLADNAFSWRNLGQILRGAAEVFSPMENTVLNNKARLQELNGVLNDPNFGGNFRFNIKELADDLGISEQAAFNLVAATGKLEVAQRAGSNAFLEVKWAAKDYMDQLMGVSRETGVAVDEMLGQQVSVESLAKSYGVSMSTIQSAMAQAKVTEADLMDPKKYEDVLAKLDALIGPWQRIGDAAGLTADQIEQAIRATDNLIAAQSELADAFDKVKAARMAAEFPIENLRQATEAFAKATEEYKTGNISLEQYGQALLNLNSAQAAVAPNVDAAMEAQRRNTAAFRDTALAMKATEDEITNVLVSWGLLTRAEAAKLQVEGGDVLDLARKRVLDLRESLRGKFIAEMAVERGTTEADIERLLAQGDEWATSTFEAKMDAATEAPLREIADLMVAAGVWSDLEAEAFLSLNPDQAFAVLEASFSKMETWKGPWVGIMTADNNDVLAREGQARGVLQDFSQGDYLAILSGDNTDVMAKAEGARQTGRNFADDSYEAQYTADNTDAVTKAAGSRSTGRFFADDRYNAILTADNSNAMSRTNDAKTNADEYGAKRPNAVLSATDNASGVIQGAINRLNQFQSKSITITATTINRSVGTSGIAGLANGGVIRSYAGGGIENHVAQVARGRWPVRVWAEPETGGEAYIPMSPTKRPRSTAILGTVARDFGYNLVPMASGGMLRDQGSLAAVMAAAGFRSLGSNQFSRESIINIQAPVTLNFDGAGNLDEAKVARLTEASVNRALERLNRKLANARR